MKYLEKCNACRDQMIIPNFVYSIGYFFFNAGIARASYNVMELIPDVLSKQLAQYNLMFIDRVFGVCFIKVLFANYILQKYLFIVQNDHRLANLLLKYVDAPYTNIIYVFDNGKRVIVPFISLIPIIIDFEKAYVYDSYDSLKKSKHPLDNALSGLFFPGHIKESAMFDIILTRFENQFNKDWDRSIVMNNKKNLLYLKNKVLTFWELNKNNHTIDALYLINDMQADPQLAFLFTADESNSIVYDITKLNKTGSTLVGSGRKYKFKSL